MISKFPTKVLMYRMTPDRFTFHKLMVKKGPSFFSTCASNIMVYRRQDDSEDRKVCVTVNYQA